MGKEVDCAEEGFLVEIRSLPPLLDTPERVEKSIGSRSEGSM